MSVLKPAEALARLRRHQAELTGPGVAHLSVFGSVARDTAEEASDVDVVVDSPDGIPLGLFRRMIAADIVDAF